MNGVLSQISTRTTAITEMTGGQTFNEAKDKEVALACVRAGEQELAVARVGGNGVRVGVLGRSRVADASAAG